MLLWIYRSSRPHIARPAKQGEVWLDTDRHPDLATRPDAIAVRVEPGLMLANADHVKSQIEARDIGQIRDTLRKAGEAPRLEIDATIDDALAAYGRKANQGSAE